MMPEKPAEPDPVEEELKAPMKAAGPVPGSIGSAVSMPTDGSATGSTAQTGAMPAGATAGAGINMNAQPAPQNVAFNDPAAVAVANEQTAAMAKNGKPKMTKQTLILLCVVAGIVVLVLIIVLVMMLNGML